MTPVRVFLVDDQALVRGGFRMLIEAEDDMRVVGEAADGADAVAALARRLSATDNPARVLVLTTFDLDEYVFAALKAGASGFLLKDARPAELLTAIRNVAAGDAVVAPSATRRLLAHVLPSLPGSVPSGGPDVRLKLLTARELEVLGEIAAGATNAEISTKLYMAEGTVKTHIGRLLSKLAIRDRVGLVLFAYETGVVTR
jgi:DNA-binding NarL/FixJ family response regulator